MKLSRDTQARIDAHIAALADSELDVVIRARRRLERFGARAVDALLAATHDANPQVRCHAAIALGNIGIPRAFPCLVEMTADPDEDVSGEAAWAIGALAGHGDPRGTPHLLEMLRRGDTAHGGVGWGLDMVEESLPALVPDLIAVVDDPTVNWDARCTAAFFLREAGTPEAAAALGRLLADPDEDVRIAALDQLALTPNPAAHALIESAYGDASEKVRKYARWAAAEWRKDREEERRAAAREARQRSPQSGESC